MFYPFLLLHCNIIDKCIFIYVPDRCKDVTVGHPMYRNIDYVMHPIQDVFVICLSKASLDNRVKVMYWNNCWIMILFSWLSLCCIRLLLIYCFYYNEYVKKTKSINEKRNKEFITKEGKKVEKKLKSCSS